MDAVTADGVRVSYDDAGRGEPALLFLSGWCASRTVYENLAARCSTRRRLGDRIPKLVLLVGVA